MNKTILTKIAEAVKGLPDIKEEIHLLNKGKHALLTDPESKNLKSTKGATVYKPNSHYILQKTQSIDHTARLKDIIRKRKSKEDIDVIIQEYCNSVREIHNEAMSKVMEKVKEV